MNDSFIALSNIPPIPSIRFAKAVELSAREEFWPQHDNRTCYRELTSPDHLGDFK
jgi:hypothetical protein